jgi:aspartate aminotransferase
MNWGKHCVVETKVENDFMPTAADLAPHISGAALLCLCSPQNPTGTTFKKEELEKICDLVLAENKKRGAAEKKLYVMYDQMYWMLTYGTTQHYNPVSLRPEMKEYTIFVDGISKAFAATGVRVGWTLGPAAVIGKIKSFLSHIGAWAPLAEQKATAKFLNNSEAVLQYLSPFKQKLQQRLHKFYEGFLRLKEKGFPVDVIAPQAAIYLTVKIDLVGKEVLDKQLETQAAVTNYILSEAKLAIVPFSCFGADAAMPWYRISVGTCKLEDIDVVIEGLEKALEKVATANSVAS